MNTKEEELRRLICDIGRNLFNKDFIAANDGNISARLSATEVITSPTGVSKGYLQPHMLVKVNLQGDILEAAEGYRPSTEVKMHLKIYNESAADGRCSSCTSAICDRFCHQG